MSVKRSAALRGFMTIVPLFSVALWSHQAANAQSCAPRALPTSLPSPGLPASAESGASIATYSNLAIVGAPGADNAKGKIFIYELVNGTWGLIQSLAPQDLAPGDRFGAAVAYHGGALFVGAPLADTNGVDAGATYTFLLTSDFGSYYFYQSDKQVPVGVEAGDRYGSSLSAYFDTFVAGAPKSDEAWVDQGAAYVLDDTGPFWGEGYTVTKLVATTPQFGESFGASVAIYNQHVAIGAPGFDSVLPSATNAGRVHLYKRQGSSGNYTWPKLAEINPAGAKPERAFGNALDVRIDRLVIGAPGDVNGFGVQTGAAHVYRFDYPSTTWAPESVLIPAAAQAGSATGTGVAFSYDGATDQVRYAWITGTDRVFQYELMGGWWLERAELSAPFADLVDGVVKTLGPKVAASKIPNLLVAKPGGIGGGVGEVFPFHACGGEIANLGIGTLGLGGVPKLRAEGSLAGNLPFELRLKYGKPNAPALALVHAGTSVALNFHGGILYTYPIHLALPLSLNGAGELTIPAIMPAGYSGVSFVLQAVIADPLAKGGASISNGVSLKLAP